MPIKTIPTDYSTEAQILARRQALVDALQKQAMQPMQAGQSGRLMSTVSPLQGLGGLGEALLAKSAQNKLDTDTRALMDKFRTDSAESMTQAMSALQGSELPQAGPVKPGESLPNVVTPGNPLLAAAVLAKSPNPAHQQMAASMMAEATKMRTLGPDAALYRGTELVATNKKPTKTTWQDFGGYKQRVTEQGDLVGERVPKTESPDAMLWSQHGKGNGSGKQLPAQALKLQQQELDELSAASSINADLGVLKNTVETGKLDLGPVSNFMSQAKNYTGMSDDNSKAFASFRATLERLRNDSLRLNKGVQTEGDSVRAWNELIQNINDPAIVSNRLDEIQKINQRAMNFRKMNIDAIRSNYGVEPLDTSGYEHVAPAVNAPAAVPGGGGIKFLGFE